VDAIQQVVAQDQGHAWQVNKSRENHHRRPNRPDHPRGELIKIETEGPSQFYERELEQDEQEAASEKEAAGLSKTPSASAIKVCCKTREKNEGRGAKCVIQRVRNSAGSVTSRGFQPPPLKKSRVWPKTIRAMTAEEIDGVKTGGPDNTIFQW
jgi:hypothetical protein